MMSPVRTIYEYYTYHIIQILFEHVYYTYIAQIHIMISTNFTVDVTYLFVRHGKNQTARLQIILTSNSFLHIEAHKFSN